MNSEFYYAPILITTLNRYQHLKRCIESLQKNPYAIHTELFISLDYPLKESQKQGYLENKRMLSEEIIGFKKVHVYIQNKNRGALNNGEWLISEIERNYDRYIVAEDDNEFSPNFIEYMDKTLEAYKNDKKCFMISAYLPLLNWEVADESAFALQVGRHYGGGFWTEKSQANRLAICNKKFEKIGNNPFLLIKLYKTNIFSLFAYVFWYMIQREPFMFNDLGQLRNIDVTQNINAIIHDYYSIFPTISKSYNWGYDGSGEHCGVADEDEKQSELDTATFFNLKIHEPSKIKKHNRRLGIKAGYDVGYRGTYIIWLHYFAYKILGRKNYLYCVKKWGKKR